MKKARIALVLILTVMLLAGIACDSSGGGQSYTDGYADGYAAGLAKCSSDNGNGGGTQCSVCGRYIRTGVDDWFVQLDSDGTYLSRVYGYGTWEQDGNEIALKRPDGDVNIATLQGDTLTIKFAGSTHFYVKK